MSQSRTQRSFCIYWLVNIVKMGMFLLWLHSILIFLKTGAGAVLQEGNVLEITTLPVVKLS